jgi:Protein of unknown function (DUF1329)
MKVIVIATAVLLAALLTTGGTVRADQPYDPSTYTSMAEPTDSIPIGTRITIQNWQNYQKFMSLGLRSLMSQKYFWKVPADAVLEVAPTVKIGLPRKYREDTEKYHNQTKLIQKGEGYTIGGYVAGMPFPDIDPKDPLAGVKLIYDNYYNYIPYRVFSEAGPKNGAGWSSVDRYSNKTYSYVYEIYFKFKHLSDPGMGVDAPDQQGDIFLSQNNVVWQPEQSKYTNDLLIFYDDPARDPEVYVFVPALRRSLRLSSAARCAPLLGGDYVADDSREGLNIQPPIFQGKLLGIKRVLEIAHADPAGYQNYNNYFSPVTFPKPGVGKWELRDAYVVDIVRIPSMQRGYCYAHRIVFLDKETLEPIDVDLYDNSGNFWKGILNIYYPTPLPGSPGDFVTALGGPGNICSTLWDIQNNHITFAIMYNSKIDNEMPDQYKDSSRWGTPAGMSQVLQ